MALNEVAKRIYNVAPDPVTLTLDDGTVLVVEMRSAEFFQESLQAEATAADGSGVEYRITTDGDAVVVGRKGPDEGGWSLVGEAVAAAAADLADES